jgi:hypothetical protein
VRDIKARNEQEEPDRPQNEEEAIADIFRRMEQIKKDLEHERRRRKALEATVEEKL